MLFPCVVSLALESSYVTHKSPYLLQIFCSRLSKYWSLLDVILVFKFRISLGKDKT